MIVEEVHNWQDFCQWLFAQPAALNRLRATTETQQLKQEIIELATQRGFPLHAAALDAQARELQLQWLQRWL